MPPDDHATRPLHLGDRFRIGSWVVDPTANEVARDDHVERLEPKAMGVLVHLAARAGEVVTREALIEAVWSDVVVTDSTLSRCVSHLRKALGDEARAPGTIETIPRVGYRLIASVEPFQEPVATPIDAPASLRAGSPTSSPVEGPPPGASMPPPGWAAASRYRLAGVGLGAAAVALVVVAVWAMRPEPAPPVLAPPEPLTSMPGIELMAALSPDGSRVVFVSFDSTGQHLYIQAVGSDVPVRLTRKTGPETSPAWSPDGTEIAFFRYEDEAAQLFRVDGLGQGERKIVGDLGRTWGLAWAPDGASLVYSAFDTTGTFRLFALDLETRGVRALTTPPASYRGDVEPVFSPDGRSILFKRSLSEGVADLYRIDRAGGDPEPLTHDDATITGYAWTLDSEAVLFVSTRGGLSQFWHLPVPGGVPRLFPGVPARDPGRLVLAPTGTHVLFEDWDIEVNLWMAPTGEPGVTPTLAEPLVASTGDDRHPALTTDGAHLAFVSTRSGAPELWRARADGTGLVRLTAFDGPAVVAPQWSPDGRHIAFESYAEGSADLYVVDADGGRPRRLTTSAANERLPRWSRDGRWLYFASDRSGTWQIWKMPTVGGPARPVTRNGGFAALESPGGQTLYFTHFIGQGLWAMPARGGPAVRVTQALAPFHWGDWTVNESGLYVLDRRRSVLRLVRLDLETGALTPLGPVLDRVPLPGPSLAVSADGRTILFARTDRAESDLMWGPLPVQQ